LKPWKAESLLLFVTLIWGATFTFTKLGLDDCPAFLFIFFRFSIALTISLIIWGKHLLIIDKKTLIHGLVLGSFFAGGFVLQTVGLNYTTVTKSAFITGMTVVITPFAFKLIIKKKILFVQIIGVVIATVGLWVFTNPTIGNINIGDVLTFFSAFFWAFYITYVDVFTKEITKFHRTIQIVIMQFIVAIPVGLAGYFIFESGYHTLNFSGNLLFALLFNGIIASIILTLIHTSVQKYSNPVKAALIFTLEPVFASIIAFLALGEGFSSLEAVGATILFAGVIFSETGSFFLKFPRSFQISNKK
jgi:drug/metabolite transporter (DMT)-like permease